MHHGPIHDIDSLQAHLQAGHTPDYLPFWGHRPPRDGSVNQSCFSQWFEAPFTIDGTRYASAEHYMMAGKARLFGDQDCLARILAADSPADAKRLGREIAGFDEARWNAERFGIVVDGNTAKFGQNAALGRYLLETGDKVLVEASPVDAIWGIGLAADDPRARSPATWAGLNLLGFALMAARERLRAAP